MTNVQKFIDNVGWNENFKNVISKYIHGNEDFNDLQSEFIKWGGLEKERVLISAPTASGKTLLGILGILKRLNNNIRTFIYLVPYNSIRDEKYNEFLENFEGIDIIIKKGYGGLKDLHKGEANLIISDYSAFDHYSREHPNFELASFYIFDEIDVLGSNFFGPSIEGSIARLLRKGELNLLAISATIPESNKLTEWLKAEFLKSDYRPIEPNEEIIIAKDFHEKICDLFLNDDRTRNKSILVMIYNKPRVMSYSRKISELLQSKSFTPLKEDQMILDIIGKNPKTKTNKILIDCLKYRVAFHHSDLHSSIKNKIIEYYNKDQIKIIICTPTLLRGVNLKTRTVILPDTSIYIPDLYRSIPMPYIDYLQCKGRAGRPPFENKAYLFLFTNSEISKRQLEKLYFQGAMEPLKSGFIDYKNRLNYPLLDKQILIELYNSSHGIEDLIDIFSKYYFAVGVPDLKTIKDKLNKRISNLVSKRLIEKDIYDQFISSLFGDEYLRKFEHNKISIDDFDRLTRLSLKILIDKISFDERFHFKIINELLTIIGYRNFIRIEKRGRNKIEIEEEIRDILRNKCGIHTETINSHQITLVCLIEHLSHTPLEIIDERFGVDSTRLESVLKDLLNRYLEALINMIQFLFENVHEVFDEEIKIGEEFNNISCEKLVELLSYLKLRIRYGVRFELVPIVTIPNIGNYRGISLYNALNLRFRDKRELEWNVLKEIKTEFISQEITGWGKSLKEKLYDELNGVLKVENSIKKLLKKFNIDYNLRR